MQQTLIVYSMLYYVYNTLLHIHFTKSKGGLHTLLWMKKKLFLTKLRINNHISILFNKRHATVSFGLFLIT